MPLHSFHNHRLARGEHLPGNAHPRRVFTMAGAGRGIRQAKPQQPGLRLEKHQMRAQKSVPGGKHAQQIRKGGQKRTPRPQRAGHKPQRFQPGGHLLVRSGGRGDKILRFGHVPAYFSAAMRAL